MPGYANRVVRLDFADLTAEGDPLVHLVIKNPRIVPLDEIQPADVPLGPDGTPDEGRARAAMYDVIAHLAKAGLLYDGRGEDVDEFGNEIEQRRLEFPLTGEDVAHLPWEITGEVLKLIRAVTNPS